MFPCIHIDRGSIQNIPEICGFSHELPSAMTGSGMRVIEALFQPVDCGRAQH